jgi:FKBP-type peptidyl-prolyl cis-trans isomerase 2
VKIEKGRRVRIKVMLKVKDGDVLEKNVVEYFQGGGVMLPGLEAVLEGLEKGAKKSGTLPAEKAFGDPSKHVEKVISRKEFPEDAEFEVGARFMAKGADGTTDVVLQVEKVTDDEIVCAMLHPLADKDIEYDVEVLQVTDPTPPPLPAQAVAADSDDD